jgi:hypothetical protein
LTLLNLIPTPKNVLLLRHVPLSLYIYIYIYAACWVPVKKKNREKRGKKKKKNKFLLGSFSVSFSQLAALMRAIKI